MRLPALLAASLLTANLAATPLAKAQPCARPADLAALDVASLKSQLMITALTCDARDKYNTFVLRFRRDLMTQERALQSYFFRGFGRNGQEQHDSYITLLANAQSQAGLRDGTLFCQRNAALLDEVLALPNGASLARYATSKALDRPVEVAACPATQVAHN